MLKKIKKKYDSFLMTDLNNLLLIFTLLLFLISLFFLKNIYVYFFIYIFLFDLTRHIKKNKYILSFNWIIEIFLIVFLFFNLLNLSFLSLDIKKIMEIIVKIFFFVDYFLIILLTIKDKKYKIMKLQKRRLKKYTFKELRERKIDDFKRINQEIINEYLKTYNILKDSDYYKVINDNYLNKTKEDLEEYVWINYLRFYKNKKYQKASLDKTNFLFLGIHGIILLLVLLVR